MSKTTRIDKIDADACDVLRPVITEALNAALAPYGVSGSIGKITYYGTRLTTTLEVITASNDEEQFKMLVRTTKGLKADWFGKTFELNGEQVRVVGADLKRSKFPVVIQRLSNGEFSGYTVEGLRLQFDAEAFRAERVATYPKNLEAAMNWFGDYEQLQPYAAVLAVGAELPNGRGEKVVGLSDHPMDVAFKKNKLVIAMKDGQRGFYPLPKLVGYLKAASKAA